MKMRTKSFFKNFLTPDVQKSSKNLEILKQIFFPETTKKILIHVLDNILSSIGEFKAHIMKIGT